MLGAAEEAIARSEWDFSPGVRAYRSRHLVASGGLDGVSRVMRVTPTVRADGLRAAPLSIQGALRHAGGLSAVEIRPSGVLLTACRTNSALRVYELEAAQLAALASTQAGHQQAPHHDWTMASRQEAVIATAPVVA